jgi:NADH:ubiquinone oxidoreductase subunit D
VSNGKPNPYRYHVRPASFVNMGALEHICKGTKIQDFIPLLAMLDIVMGELDR